jgi:Phosphopantetheine attachment site
MAETKKNPNLSTVPDPETESVLAEFWRELLEIDNVSPSDRILELGGNSLVAVMLANRMELTWGYRPSMEEIFSCTLRELAELCYQDSCSQGGE